jgi:hypothetical protein
MDETTHGATGCRSGSSVPRRRRCQSDASSTPETRRTTLLFSDVLNRSDERVS